MMSANELFGPSNKPSYSFFAIQSEVDNHGTPWCLQEASHAAKQGRQTLLVASICNGSSAQRWAIDEKGSLINERLRHRCIKKAGRHLKFDFCTKTTPQLQWILSSDGTIRYKFFPLYLIAVPQKFTSSSMLLKQTVGIQLKKVINREAKAWEQWRIVFGRETIAPTIAPTITPSTTPSGKCTEIVLIN